MLIPYHVKILPQLIMIYETKWIKIKLKNYWSVKKMILHKLKQVNYSLIKLDYDKTNANKESFKFNVKSEPEVGD